MPSAGATRSSLLQATIAVKGRFNSSSQRGVRKETLLVSLPVLREWSTTLLCGESCNGGWQQNCLSQPGSRSRGDWLAQAPLLFQAVDWRSLLVELGASHLQQKCVWQYLDRKTGAVCSHSWLLPQYASWILLNIQVCGTLTKFWLEDHFLREMIQCSYLRLLLVSTMDGYGFEWSLTSWVGSYLAKSLIQCNLLRSPEHNLNISLCPSGRSAGNDISRLSWEQNLLWAKSQLTRKQNAESVLSCCGGFHKWLKIVRCG